MSRTSGDELGRRLLVGGFRPLPDVDDNGALIGTRLWRMADGHIEYLALRRDGLAHAVRAEARFDYRRPTEHGQVIEHRFGAAANALDWLLAGVDEPPTARRDRPYAPPVWHQPDHEEGPR